jgi:hypothetical protein
LPCQAARSSFYLISRATLCGVVRPWSCQAASEVGYEPYRIMSSQCCTEVCDGVSLYTDMSCTESAKPGMCQVNHTNKARWTPKSKSTIYTTIRYLHNKPQKLNGFLCAESRFASSMPYILVLIDVGEPTLGLARSSIPVAATSIFHTGCLCTMTMVHAQSNSGSACGVQAEITQKQSLGYAVPP